MFCPLGLFFINNNHHLRNIFYFISIVHRCGGIDCSTTIGKHDGKPISWMYDLIIMLYTTHHVQVIYLLKNILFYLFSPSENWNWFRWIKNFFFQYIWFLVIENHSLDRSLPEFAQFSELRFWQPTALIT